MTVVLITGANGFVGSNLVRRLVKNRQISVIVRNKSNLWRIKDVLSQLDVHILDLSNINKIKKVIRKVKPDTVYHCAAYGIKPNQKDIINIFKNNTLSTLNLLLALEEYGSLKRLINLGSSFEYGSIPDPIKETDPTRPLTPYGIAKNSQTQLVQYFANQNRLPAVTLRVFAPYGNYEEPRRLVSDIMVSLIKNNRLTIFSRKARRDFIFVDDVINALIKAERKKGINGEIFNIGTGIEHTVEDVVKIACEVTKKDLQILWKDQKQREFDKMGGRGYANIRKAKKIDWKPQFSLKEGLMKTYDWYKENINQYSM